MHCYAATSARQQLLAQVWASSSTILSHRRSLCRGSASKCAATNRSIHAMLAGLSQRVPRGACAHAQSAGCPVRPKKHCFGSSVGPPRDQTADRPTIYLPGNTCRGESSLQLGLLPKFYQYPFQGYSDVPVTAAHNSTCYRDAPRPYMQRADAMPVGFRLCPSRVGLPHSSDVGAPCGEFRSNGAPWAIGYSTDYCRVHPGMTPENAPFTDTRNGSTGLRPGAPVLNPDEDLRHEAGSTGTAPDGATRSTHSGTVGLAARAATPRLRQCRHPETASERRAGSCVDTTCRRGGAQCPTMQAIDLNS